eukprot:TRINITY_DN4022_c0_g1_i1.p1 TRINITY_DN4022_c0_g1~~TRINITY_DN4022_c0_g1_i1.p1  ORF type:complete len:213 (+),score=32.79 TRINITY_DN4022_c0_g1_i1:20-658(+)
MSKGQQVRSIPGLPAELLVHFCEFLAGSDLLALGCTSRKWHAFTLADVLWRPLCTVQREGKQLPPPGVCVGLPELEKNIPAWQQYRMAKDDSKREKITEAEICANWWQFEFLHDWGGEHTQLVRFADGKLFMEWGFPPMSWRFVTEENGIQVEHYPVLRYFRREDWGWQLRNTHVVFSSLGPEPLLCERKCLLPGAFADFEMESSDDEPFDF